MAAADSLGNDIFRSCVALGDGKRSRYSEGYREGSEQQGFESHLNNNKKSA